MISFIEKGIMPLLVQWLKKTNIAEFMACSTHDSWNVI